MNPFGPCSNRNQGTTCPARTWAIANGGNLESEPWRNQHLKNIFYNKYQGWMCGDVFHFVFRMCVGFSFPFATFFWVDIKVNTHTFIYIYIYNMCVCKNTCVCACRKLHHIHLRKHLHLVTACLQKPKRMYLLHSRLVCSCATNKLGITSKAKTKPRPSARTGWKSPLVPSHGKSQCQPLHFIQTGPQTSHESPANQNCWITSRLLTSSSNLTRLFLPNFHLQFKGLRCNCASDWPSAQ